MNLKKNIKKVLKEETDKFELVKNFIYTMFDNVSAVEYIAKRNEIMVYYKGKPFLTPTVICDTINDYIGLNVLPYYEYNKNNVGIWEPDFYIDSEDEEYDEELNENYSPAGKEIIPNEIVVHKSNPIWRKNILETGLQVSVGECYKTYVGYGEKCIPAIFATNSINKRAWFDSTYDDDVWAINTELIPNVKWYKDRHFESSKKHIVTFDNIPSDAIELMREGTGRDMIRESSENKDMTNDIEKNLKAIRMLLKQVSWEGLCDIWVKYNYVDKEYEIRSKSELQDEISPLADIQEELVFLSNIIRSIGLSSYIYGTWFVDNCEDEVKFMDENINESKEESKKEMIENVLNNIILPEYGHVICGFEVKAPNERVDDLGKNPSKYQTNQLKFVSVTVTFIGGHGTKLFPQTQGIKQMYDNILDEIWQVIYNYTNEAVDTFYKTVNDCGKKNIYLKESIRKVLKEDTEIKSNYQKVIDKFKKILPKEYSEKVDEVFEYIKDFINKKGFNLKVLNNCQVPFKGTRTKDFIIICSPELYSSLPDLIYIIFHEIRHEIQMGELKQINPLSGDLENFDELYDIYWKMEMDAHDYAIEWVDKIGNMINLPKEYYKLSSMVTSYPSMGHMVRDQIVVINKTIQELKKNGYDYNDISDLPFVKKHLDKLENLF
jgi:hypothetical protein